MTGKRTEGERFRRMLERLQKQLEIGEKKKIIRNMCIYLIFAAVGLGLLVSSMLLDIVLVSFVVSTAVNVIFDYLPAIEAARLMNRLISSGLRQKIEQKNVTCR